MADAARLRHVAEIITDTYKAGNQVVAVLFCPGDTTDELIEKANEINPLASNREMDMLLSTGEQMSVALCAMAVEALGYPVISLTGWQAGMVTNTVARNARIKKVDTERIETELNQKKIVIVTGFQESTAMRISPPLAEADLTRPRLRWLPPFGRTCARYTRMWTGYIRLTPES